MIVNFFFTRDRVGTGTRVPIAGQLDFLALAARTIVGTPDEMVLPVVDPVTLDEFGKATVTLPAGYWRVMLRGPHSWPVPVYVQIGAGAEADWADTVAIPRIDPATLDPAAEPDAAWTVALAASAAAVQALIPDSPDDIGAATAAQGALADAAIQPGDVRRPGSAARTAIEQARIAPTLHPITEHIDYFRNVLIVDGATIYAVYSTNGANFEWHKSVNGGLDWTKVGDLPGDCQQALKLTSGTILAMQLTATNPNIWRSTDDGATWATISGQLLRGPLGNSGMAEGSDGSVMIAEYTSTVENTSRLRRSTDDGLTWGTAFEVALHHMHSVTYDHIAGRFVVFADDTSGPAIPQIWASTDSTGASWVKLGDVTNVNHPNFVTPMYFANHIAWGSDNEINGRISRILRTDFYAGNFGTCEQVALLSRRAAYGAFPLRADVWAVAFNGEHIASSPDLQPEGPGSTMCDVWLVSGDGEIVSGGMESVRFLTQPGELSGVRPWFPSRMFGVVDHDGLLWANMPAGPHRGYASVPATQGWDSGAQRIDHLARSVVLDKRVPLLLQKGDNPADGYIRIIDPQPTSILIHNDTAASGARAQLQLNDTGEIELRSNGALAAKLAGGVFMGWGRIDLAATGVGLRAGAGSPEGVVTAAVGSLYQTYNTDLLYYKQSGTGNVGWRRLLPPALTTANFASITHAVNTSMKYAGMQGFDTTAGRPVWATGATAAAVWVFADGSTAATPA